MKRLFRKVDDKSSQYDPNHDGKVRRDGSYIIEEFLATGAKLLAARNKTRAWSMGSERSL